MDAMITRHNDSLAEATLAASSFSADARCYLRLDFTAVI